LHNRGYCPAFAADFDAAMFIKPEHWTVASLGEKKLCDEHGTQNGKRGWVCTLSRPDVRGTARMFVTILHVTRVTQEGMPPAAALCLAGMDARVTEATTNAPPPSLA